MAGRHGTRIPPAFPGSLARPLAADQRVTWVGTVKESSYAILLNAYSSGL